MTPDASGGRGRRALKLRSANHSSATGITDYLKSKPTLEQVQAMANHSWHARRSSTITENVKLFEVYLLHSRFLTKLPDCFGIDRFLFPDKAAWERVAIFEGFREIPDQEKVALAIPDREEDDIMGSLRRFFASSRGSASRK